jgi:hypothetical protein
MDTLELALKASLFFSSFSNLRYIIIEPDD